MSTYHLSDLIQDAAVKMGTIAIYKPSPVATSGDRQTITDTTLALGVNDFVHALCIITFDAGGAGAAPEGEIGNVVSNTATALTFATNTFSVAIAAGDEIMLIRPKYPLTEWLRGANSVLKSLGEVPLWDTSITMTSLSEYALPTTILEPTEVYIQGNQVTGNNQWERASGWTIQPAAPGTAKTIRFKTMDVFLGRKVGLVYHGDHPTVHTWSDSIDIPIELAAGKLAWHMINRGGIKDRTKTQADKILSELNDAEAKFRIPNKSGKKQTFLSWERY